MRNQIYDEGDPRNYWTQLPNIVFELGLKPLELVLYAHLKRAAGANAGGKCTKSTATLARETGMGAGTVSRTKSALEAKRSLLGNRPLIRTREIPNPRGGKPFQEITITDIWKVNSDYFAPSTVEVGPNGSSSSAEIDEPNQVPVEVDPSSKPISTVEIKKNSKKNYKEEPSAHSRLMAFHNANTAGGIPDGAAQAGAVKWLLERFTPAQCEAEYEKLRSAEWRTVPVTWLTVKKYIGGDVAREAQQAPNGHDPAGHKILTDYGDWYTIEGADGTPSKRYRTAEAFARETGRNLEEVMENWN